jgi:lactate dehydrogenase-like 2-hydroxyacid dehydrogenase
LNTIDTVAVASRSFSRNENLVKSLQSKYSSVIFNDFGKTLQGDELVEFLMPATKAIIGIEELTESVLAKLTKLKVISKYGVGLNNLDLDLLKKRNIRLGFTPGVNKQSVAELTLTLILIGLKKIQDNSIDIIRGNWPQEKGSELYGKNIGLLGFGNISQKLASLIQPFNCKISFFDEKKFSKEEISDIASKLNYEPNSIKQISLKQVLKESDILSIHLPLTASTENIISIDELNELRSNVYIVNTARGGIVNERDLYIFLSENPCSYAGFDVYKEEPAINNPLFKLKNFFGTSHRSSLTNEGILSMGMAAINGLDDNIDIT